MQRVIELRGFEVKLKFNRFFFFLSMICSSQDSQVELPVDSKGRRSQDTVTPSINDDQRWEKNRLNMFFRPTVDCRQSVWLYKSDRYLRYMTFSPPALAREADRLEIRFHILFGVAFVCWFMCSRWSSTFCWAVRRASRSWWWEGVTLYRRFSRRGYLKGKRNKVQFLGRIKKQKWNKEKQFTPVT